MKPHELILARPDGLTESELLIFLADAVYKAKLSNGLHLDDATDFREWLLELAAASRAEQEILAGGQTARHGLSFVPSQPRYPIARAAADPCHRCGHVHEGSKECGFKYAEGRICRCELEVTA